MATKTKAPARNIERFTEAVALPASRGIDREAGVIRGVKILGKESRNGRRYSVDAIRKAVPLYESSKVCIDHNYENAKQRRTNERWGRLVNCAIGADDELYGDLEYIKSHPMTEQILEQVERFEDCGLSHDADGQMTRDSSGPIVTEIRKVFTVDFVLNPATNENLYESEGHTVKRKLLEILRENIANPLAANALARLTEAKKCMETEVEMKEGDNALDAALRTAIMEILDAEYSLEEKLNMIRELASGGESAEPAEPEPEVVEELKQLRDENSILKEEVSTLSAKIKESEQVADRASCVRLLEEKGRETSETLVEALLKLPAADRVILVEQFVPKKPAKPDKSPSKYALKENEKRDGLDSLEDAKKEAKRRLQLN